MPTHCSWDSILKRISYHFRVIYFCRARSDHFLILFQSTAPQIAVSPPLVGKGRRAAAGDGNPSGLPSLQGKVRPSKEAWWQQFKSNFPSSQSFQRWKALHSILTLTKQAGRGTEPRQDTALLLLGWIQPKEPKRGPKPDFSPAQHLGCPNPSYKGLRFRERSWRWGHPSPEGSVRSFQQSSVPPGLETHSAHRIPHLQCQPQRTGTTAAEEGLFLSPKWRKKETGLPRPPERPKPQAGPSRCRHFLPHQHGAETRVTYRIPVKQTNIATLSNSSFAFVYFTA